MGLTYRMLDYWTTRGFLKAAIANPGSGKRRTWSDDELATAARMVRLISCGFTVAKAAEIARGRTGYASWLSLGDGIHLLIYENQPTEAAS
jgi:DNA-binding transcriptional MerR regulator